MKVKIVSFDTKKVNLDLITLINHLENPKTPNCITIVLMEILSNRIVSTNGADGQNLRHFIDSIGQYEAPPPDFITSVDSDNSSFLHQGKEYWLTEIFFHWGKDCTKTGTQMAKETPRPWLCLPKIDVIHNEFSGMYLYYNPNLSENEREILDPESQSQFMSELMSH